MPAQMKPVEKKFFQENTNQGLTRTNEACYDTGERNINDNDNVNPYQFFHHLFSYG